MKVYRQLSECHLPASACALGMFDGVHPGHRMVLESAIRDARIRGIQSVVFSFARHPQFLLSKTPTRQLSTLEDRLARFEQMGFDAALILDFDDWLKNLSAKEFITDILIAHLHIQSVSIGYDHCFGKNRAGNSELLKQWGETYGYKTHVIDPVMRDGQIISSTLIRKLLTYGDIDEANALLGHVYQLAGLVEPGFQRGQQIGFPTANLRVPNELLVPAVGTYGGHATLNGVTYPALCNVGYSPTFETESEPQKRVEVHMLDYTGPAFYGEMLGFSFETRLRDEIKFPTVDALIAQIHQDCDTLKKRLAH